ncbi:hypothetical protein [uncultured Massilia sp.]|uniref:hypothetical protein n=1 Tax=uncultured Massilia sp. TaxID=169973 RepID=UPI00258FFA72|nr:hypothetical protein [uncultured Massilia sp.]
MNNISRLAVLLVCTIGAAQAAEPMPELGMPLGKKMAMPILPCAEQEAGVEAAALCWVKPPRDLEDRTVGTLKVSASADGGQWSASGVYHVAVGYDGKLISVGVHSSQPDEFEKIRHALSVRFGEPARGTGQNGSITSTSWNWKDAVIDLACVRDSGCVTNFALIDRGENMRRNLANRPFLMDEASEKMRQRTVR